MSGAGATVSRRTLSPRARTIATAVVVVLVLVAMALCTKVVPKGSTLGAGPAAFNAAAYGKKQFPVQQKYIEAHAVEATTLATALQNDATAAAKQYGTPLNDGASTEVSVRFTGVVGDIPAAGFTPVKVAGLPSGYQVNVQVGPAITGTDLRDASGDKIQLGQFENQIQFQNAGTAINDQLKKLLTKAGAQNSSGKTVAVTGVFSLVNPKVWNVTPATFEVQQ